MLYTGVMTRPMSLEYIRAADENMLTVACRLRFDMCVHELGTHRRRIPTLVKLCTMQLSTYDLARVRAEIMM